MGCGLTAPPPMCSSRPAIFDRSGGACMYSLPLIEPVVVTATRTESPVDTVLASVDIISGAELRRQPAADLGDLLRMRAGVEVARLGGPGQQTSLFLRGTDSNHVLVLVDGVRIKPGTIGSASIQNIAPELVERVEIVKGPRSTLYGSDALGGVINVITRRRTENGASVQAGVGSYDSRSASIDAGIGGTRGDASLGVSWVNSDGFPTRSGDSTDRGYENLSLTAAARTDLPGVELGLRAWHAEGTSEYSDFFVTPVDQDFENAVFALTAGFAPAESWHSRVTLAHMLDELEQNQSTEFQPHDFLRTRRWQIDWQNDIAVSEHHALTAGVVWQDEEADAESFGLPYAADIASSQFYLQDQMSFGRAQILLAAGFVDHETFGGHQTWNAAFGFALGDATMLTLAAGSAFRAPDATDLYGYGGNAALDPERSQSYEASLRHNTAGGHRFSVTLFRNEIDDLIEYVVTDFVTYEGENRNVERARIEGLETSWRYEGERWAANATATLQDPHNLVTDERLLRRAEEHFTLAVSRRIGAHEIAVDLLHAGDRKDIGDFGNPPVTLPAYWLANLSASVALNERWTLLARMENLLDEDYELARGYNTMGRSLFVAVRHEFR
ncbi:MAG: TonB-dependent receptor [Gammaproteobacteria bacterium]|nr:TonB-dependent receptor [Gammaproteobacteria bacterium]